MTSPSLSYQSRLSAERAIFDNQLDVHDLPQIHHYWANRHLRPLLEPYGFSHPNDVFFQTLNRRIGECSRPMRFLSVGAGNCDMEVALAARLQTGNRADFTIDCLDLNPAMLHRGRGVAEDAGLAGHFDFLTADFNSWEPAREYDAVIANQSLHHVVNLEHLFAGIRSALTPGAPFVISDMIGRNGHRRWPEARAVINEFWRKLPPSHRWNRALSRFEERFEDSDCSTEGFEGVRSQDVLALLLEVFHFEFFFGFANVIDPFIDRQFGYNFDPDEPWVRQFIDEVHARDEAEQLSGNITPTHMLAVVTADASAREPVFYPRPPCDAVRDPEKITTETEEPDLGNEGYEIAGWSHLIPEEFSFLGRAIAAAEQKATELERWGQSLDRDMAERTALIEKLDRELAERTAWALQLDQEMAGLSAWALKLEKEAADRTAWARKLEQQTIEISDWALRLEKEAAERTAWARRLEEEAVAQTAWALEMEQQAAERTAWALALEQRVCSLELDLTAEQERTALVERELEERTEWARAIETERDERAAWALHLQDQMTAEREKADKLLHLTPALRETHRVAAAIWHRLRGVR